MIKHWDEYGDIELDQLHYIWWVQTTVDEFGEESWGMSPPQPEDHILPLNHPPEDQEDWDEGHTDQQQQLVLHLFHESVTLVRAHHL